MITINGKDLDIQFRTKLLSELQDIENKLPALKDTYGKIKIADKSKIEVGSRVNIKYEDGTQQEGRVHNIKYDGTIQVNRDGYKSLINKRTEDLQNLSVGTLGKLEKEIWVLETKMEEINQIIKESILPDILLHTKENLVFAARITDSYYFQDVDIIHAKNLNSYRILLPTNTINNVGYYQIKCNDKDIVSIYASSEFAFKNYYSNSK